jgi:hypothetical protein
VGNVF